MNKTNSKREWTTCTECKSAVLKPFIQASGLCKVCDARRLSKIITVPAERSTDLREASADFGVELGYWKAEYDTDMGDFYAIGEKLTRDDISALQAHETLIDADGNTILVADLGMTADDHHAGKKKTNDLEAQADALLAYADAHAEVLALGQTDPVQMLMNKARMAFGLELVKNGSQPKLATDKQTWTLVTVLGHDKALIRQARLSISEASRLMQRGPTWKK